jgi:hypothetical protein
LEEEGQAELAADSRVSTEATQVSSERVFLKLQSAAAVAELKY